MTSNSLPGSIGGFGLLSDVGRTTRRVGTIFMMHPLEGTRPFCVEQGERRHRDKDAMNEYRPAVGPVGWVC